MKRKVLALLLCVSVMMGAVACGTSSGQTEAPDTPEAPAVEGDSEGTEANNIRICNCKKSRWTYCTGI